MALFKTFAHVVRKNPSFGVSLSPFLALSVSSVSSVSSSLLLLYEKWTKQQHFHSFSTITTTITTTRVSLLSSAKSTLKNSHQNILNNQNNDNNDNDDDNTDGNISQDHEKDKVKDVLKTTLIKDQRKNQSSTTTSTSTSTTKRKKSATTNTQPVSTTTTDDIELLQTEEIQLLQKDLSDITSSSTSSTTTDSTTNTNSTLSLRPYQADCINSSLKEIQNGFKRIVVSLPVGSGKTVVFSSLTHQLPNPTPTATKTLVLAHRTELLHQAIRQLKRFNVSATIGLEMGRYRAPPDSDIIVASVPTLGREESDRIFRFDPKEFKLIIIDEAHHAAARTYLNILNHFDVFNEKSHIVVWGCSATVQRENGDLKNVFQKVAFHLDINYMWENDWLCRIKAVSQASNIDLNEIPTKSQEFIESSLSKAVNVAERNELIVHYYKTHIQGKKNATLVFGVDINHCEDLAQAFNSNNICALALHSRVSSDTREKAVHDFKNGKIPVLINCGIFTEGTDMPIIDSIILARPTLSTVLFNQMIGRGLRLHPGKDSCLIVDIVDTTSRHSLVTVPTLLGLQSSFDAKGEDIYEIAKKIENAAQFDPLLYNAQSIDELETLESVEMRMMKNVLTLAPIEINAAGRRVSPKEHPSWMTFGNGSHLLPVPMEGYFLLKRDILSYYIATFYPQKFGVSPTTIETWSAKLHDSKKFVQDYIKTNFADAWKMMNPLAPWRKDLASPAQITRVKKEFPSIVDKLPSTLTKGQASDLITKAVLFKKALSIKSDARRDQIVSSQVNKYVRAITASKPSLPVYIPEKK